MQYCELKGRMNGPVWQKRGGMRLVLETRRAKKEVPAVNPVEARGINVQRMEGGDVIPVD